MFKSAEELKNEMREKWTPLLTIYAEALDASIPKFVNDDELVKAIGENAMKGEPFILRFNRQLLTDCLIDHCFKESFWTGFKQIRHKEIDLRPMINLENKKGGWPFPDNETKYLPTNGETDNFVVYILERSQGYNELKRRYADGGYQIEEQILPHAVVLKIHLPKEKLF